MVFFFSFKKKKSPKANIASGLSFVNFLVSPLGYPSSKSLIATNLISKFKLYDIYNYLILHFKSGPGGIRTLDISVSSARLSNLTAFLATLKAERSNQAELRAHI